MGAWNSEKACSKPINYIPIRVFLRRSPYPVKNTLQLGWGVVLHQADVIYTQTKDIAIGEVLRET